MLRLDSSWVGDHQRIPAVDCFWRFFRILEILLLLRCLCDLVLPSVAGGVGDAYYCVELLPIGVLVLFWRRTKSTLRQYGALRVGFKATDWVEGGWWMVDGG
jgi:hypothetical protein